MPSTVTNGNNNAVRQGLVSLLLCFPSLDGVYALSLKCVWQGCMPTLIYCYNKPALSEVVGGRMPADPLQNIFSIPSEDVLHPRSKDWEI